MHTTYPKGPLSVPENFTKPTSSYRLHAWLALGGLFLFVLLYFGLTYWFGSTAYKLLHNAFTGNGNGFLNFLVGGIMAFVTLFLVKALFFIKRFGKTDDIEIKAEEEPELFKFIFKVADDAGAPRPHRVFLSPQVNAAVFYDLSIINLIYPTKKNLEIGLGLVNSLTLNEFKAVLAHEFGHFAQRSMAVGRYVYIARQIAAHIIAQRDFFDNFLAGLSSFDIRVAWVGWILSIIIWSIRALVDTVFLIVVLAERALSREMEFQADLVAVSLTGSDAIVSGLYKLEAADNAWDQSLQYAFEARHEGKEVADVFALQKYFVQKIGVILDKPDYGIPPTLQNPAQERLFKKNLAHPPKMWSTHPPGFEREENAKRVYVKAENDERSPWLLFKKADDVKQRMTKHILSFAKSEKSAEPIGTEQVITELDKKYNKVFHDPKYRGYYLKLSITREINNPEELYTYPADESQIAAFLGSLYPVTLKQELEDFENKNEQLTMLKALHDKVWDAAGGAILHEGREIKRRDLPFLIQKLSDEIKERQNHFNEFNKKARTVHLKIAEKLHPSWVLYLKGLSTLIHYTEHNLANMHDAHNLLNNTLAVVLADNKVSDSEMRRILNDANQLTKILEGIYTKSDEVKPDVNVLKKLETESWSSMLEEFQLGYASGENINSWLQSVDSWIGLASDRLTRLRGAALEELILTEEKLAAAWTDSADPGYAPPPSTISHNYPRLLNGQEREIQARLSLWERFYTADGLVPSIARLTVAASIIGAAFFVGQTINSSELIIYNGLSIPIVSSLDGKNIEVGPHAFRKLDIDPADDFHIETKTKGGLSIEDFDPEFDTRTNTYVYNVASAASMLQWNIIYSTLSRPYEPAQIPLGSPRWFTSKVDYYFTDPPESISSSGGSEIRKVLTAFSDTNPNDILFFARSKSDSISLITSHVLWDDSKARNTLSWLSVAAVLEQGNQLFEKRLARYQNDLLSLRAIQDMQMSGGREKVKAEYDAKSKADPENPDLYYLATRCMEDGPAQSDAFIKGYRKWPEHGWLSYAAGYALTELEHWKDAQVALVNAMYTEPCLYDIVATDMVRISRLNRSGEEDYSFDAWEKSELLKYIMQVESGLAEDSVSLAYNSLLKGDLDQALAYAENTHAEHYIVRLAAASEGASDEIILRFLTMSPDEGISLNTIFSTIGLLAREGKDFSPYLDQLKQYIPDQAHVFESYIQSVQKGIHPGKAGDMFLRLNVRLKAYAYAMEAVYLGNKCPEELKKRASKLLFVIERPYFKLNEL